MGWICGWAGFRCSGDDREALIRAMGHRAGRAGQGGPQVLTGDACALIIGGEPPSASSAAQAGMMAGLVGRFRWLDPELAQHAAAHGDAAALIRGFERDGPKVAASLTGTFSLAVIDESGRRLALAIDRTGTEPLAYSEADGAVVFGPDAATLTAHAAVAADIDPQALFDYFYFHMVPAPGSVRGGVRRLVPGEFYSRDGDSSSTGRYWQVRYDESAAGRSFGELKDELHGLVRSSVERTADSAAVGAFLSGGVDSSTITGVLGLVREQAPKAYSIGFGVDSYNEMAYARLAAKHFGAQHREYFVTPADIVDAVPGIAAQYSEPFGNSSVVPTYFCARLAREDGVQTLLGGDGGDELFGGNERYATQKLFAVYDRLPAVVRKRLLEPALLSTKFGSRIKPVHKLRRYVEQAAVPMPERLETYNFLNFHDPAEIFDREFLEQVSASHPLEMLSETYAAVEAQNIVDKMLGLDLKFTLADNDLMKVGGACDLAGVEVAYPLLSDELVAFAASLPSQLKVKGQRLRYFFKEAYRGFLPTEILAKSKHGFGLPFGEWVVADSGLNAFVRDNLESIKARQIVRAAFIDDLVNKSLPAHPHYFGGFVWLLLMLEQWYENHEDSPAA